MVAGPGYRLGRYAGMVPGIGAGHGSGSSLDGYLASFQELQKLRPDMQLVVIEGASHGTAARSPQFLSSIQAFLMAHRIASST
jgi:hypothetical protein